MRVNVRRIDFAARTGSTRREVRIGACSVVARRHTLLRSFFFFSSPRSSRSFFIDRTRCHSCGLLRGRNCKTVTHVSQGTTSIRVEIVRSSDMNILLERKRERGILLNVILSAVPVGWPADPPFPPGCNVHSTGAFRQLCLVFRSRNRRQ